MDAASIASFYLLKSQFDKKGVEYKPAKIQINIDGSIFKPKKEVKASDFITLLKTIN